MKKFADLPLLPEIQSALTALNFTTPTEIQQKVIPVLIENPYQDVHAQAQTGTGKTVAFGIPLLHAIDPKVKAVQALVMAPTRELVLQIYESLKDVSRGLNISIVPVFGGMPIDRQIASIKRGAQIVVGTPGRINDHLRRKTLSLKKVKTFVLDEADIMLDMGFRQEIDTIFDAMPEDRNIWLFSATVLSGIKDLINSHMNNVLSFKATGKSVVTSQVKQYYCVVPMQQRIEAVTRFIQAAPNFYGIIFCQTKMLTSEVMERLASSGLSVNCLHGDMAQGLRNQVIKGFKDKDFNVLVATDVAARGIDVSDLTHVINYSLPEETENYVHRIGRTGRAGKEGVAILFITQRDMNRLKRLERVAHVELQEISVPTVATIVNAKMGAISDFIEQSKHHAQNVPSSVIQALTQTVTSFSDEEVRGALVHALQDIFFKGLTVREFAIAKPDTSTYPQELCLTLGTQDGLHEQQVRDYLYSVCSLMPQDLHKVRVLRTKTFISMPENLLESCMQKMRTKPITNQKPRVYLVQDVYEPDKKREGRGSSHRMQRRRRSTKKRSNSTGRRSR